MSATLVNVRKDGSIMKTDSQLKRDVAAELAWDPAINSDAVGVAVENGVVTVTGHLDNFAEKFAIERTLRRVHGVRAIALELDVKLSPRHRRNDTELAIAIEEALQCNTACSLDKLRVTVESGWVTLTADVDVDWEYQRRAIESVVRALIGVVGVSNKISLRPRTTPDDVTELIEEALRRQIERESKQIQVDITGSTVTLRGPVHSWSEREAAAVAAWSAPGVQSVVNELQISDAH